MEGQKKKKEKKKSLLNEANNSKFVTRKWNIYNVRIKISFKI